MNQPERKLVRRIRPEAQDFFAHLVSDNMKNWAKSARDRVGA
jgi:hypothetical protein